MKELLTEISKCQICAAKLPLGPRPIVSASPRSKVAIIGQAPGSVVHKTGIPWDDKSGENLRKWLGVNAKQFYDADTIALIPMGFCYPGKASGGDAPPRPECAPKWHGRVLDVLPEDRLTLLVGAFAQAQYLPHTKRWSMTERVKRGEECEPFIPLPHPAWRVRMWMAKNEWFANEILPVLRERIAEAIAR